jgi:hydroxyacylglutathione hydrolase
MVDRNYIFPGVIELNVQARRRLGVNVYLIDGGTEYALIDVGFLEELPDVLELIRQMNFSLSACKLILATHADADHTQGLARAREVLKCKVAAHPKSVEPLEQGDEIMTYARIDAQNIHIEMPRCKVDKIIDEGDKIQVGDRTLEVWSTPGHTAGQLAFRMGNLLFSGDNIFRDGCVGVIDAHHGSNIVDYIASLKRIRDCDAEFLLPSHGPIFRKDTALINRTINRLDGYLHMADFGTCAIDWPLLDEWEEELATGKPKF